MKEYWFPFYIAKYRQDTMHLTAEQDGIYLRLIMHYMETGAALPDNDMALARIAGVSIEQFAANAEVIRLLFTSKATAKLQLKKCEEILQEQARRRQVKAENGAKGGRGKRAEKPSEINGRKATALANESTEHNSTEHNSSKNTPKPPEGDFEGWWKNYPHKVGKGDAEKAYAKALREAEGRELREGVERYIRTKPPDRNWCNPSTWLNQQRWKDEPNETATRSRKKSNSERGDEILAKYLADEGITPPTGEGADISYAPPMLRSF